MVVIYRNAELAQSLRLTFLTSKIVVTVSHVLNEIETDVVFCNVVGTGQDMRKGRSRFSDP